MLPQSKRATWSWSLDMIAAPPPTTNDAYEALRMGGFRAALAGRKVPVLSKRDDPYEQIRSQWEEIGTLFRRTHDRNREIKPGEFYSVEWLFACWSSRGDAGSGWALAKCLGDGFWGGRGHGDHCVRRETVGVVPSAHSRRTVTMELVLCE